MGSTVQLRHPQHLCIDHMCECLMESFEGKAHSHEKWGRQVYSVRKITSFSKSSVIYSVFVSCVISVYFMSHLLFVFERVPGPLTPSMIVGHGRGQVQNMSFCTLSGSQIMSILWSDDIILEVLHEDPPVMCQADDKIKMYRTLSNVKVSVLISSSQYVAA